MNLASFKDLTLIRLLISFGQRLSSRAVKMQTVALFIDSSLSPLTSDNGSHVCKETKHRALGRCYSVTLNGLSWASVLNNFSLAG